VNNIHRRGDQFEVEGVVTPDLIEQSCSASQFFARAEAGDNRRRRMQAQDSMALAALAARNTIIKPTTGGEVAHGSEDKLLLLLDDQDRAQENGDTRSVYDITFADDQLQKCNGTDHGGTLRARKQQLSLLQKVAVIEKQKKTKKYELSEFHSLPDYIRDNEYILRHYRSDWPIPESLLSIFSIHNETLNIWTSAFIPTPFSLSLSLYIFSLCLLLTPVDLSVRFPFVLFKLKLCQC
jgi:hypothetical protein